MLLPAQLEYLYLWSLVVQYPFDVLFWHSNTHKRPVEPNTAQYSRPQPSTAQYSPRLVVKVVVKIVVNIFVKIVVIASPRASRVSIFDIFISLFPFSLYQHSQIFLMSVFSDTRISTLSNQYCPVSYIPDIIFTLNTLTLNISVGAFLDSIS